MFSDKEKVLRFLMWLLLLPVFPVAFGVMPGDAGTDGAGSGDGTGDEDGDGEGDEDGEGEGAKTYTEDQVNAIVQKRLQRESRKYKDYEDLKAAASELKKLKQADMDEVERLQRELEEVKDGAATREIDLKEREIAVNERLIRAEVRRAAVDIGFIDPDEAYMLADLSDVAIDEDDSVSNVEKALKKLAKDKPHLLKTEGSHGTGTPPRDGKKAKRGEVPVPVVRL